MSRSIPLAKAMDDVLVCLYQNGERVRPSNGYPVRLLVPGFEGNMNVKWLRRIKLVAEPTMSKDETSNTPFDYTRRTQDLVRRSASAAPAVRRHGASSFSITRCQRAHPGHRTVCSSRSGSIRIRAPQQPHRVRRSGSL